MDSRYWATHYVYCALSSFNLLYSVSNSFVALPNGIPVPMSRIGNVPLNAHVVLDNVLFVPRFQFNLVSISALTRSHHYYVIFHNDSDVIQDHTQAKMITTQYGNLYVLERTNTSPTTSVMLQSSINSSFLLPNDLWHFRLGHPSNVKIGSLCNGLSIPVKSIEHFSHCSIYPLAKQRHLPFISHNLVFPLAFDLLHCDISGPFKPMKTQGFCYFLTIVDDHSHLSKMEAPIVKDGGFKYGGFKLSIIWPPTLHFFFLVR